METVLVSVRVISTVLNAAQLATIIVMVLYPVVSLSSLTLGVNGESKIFLISGTKLQKTSVKRKSKNKQLSIFER